MARVLAVLIAFACCEQRTADSRDDLAPRIAAELAAADDALTEAAHDVPVSRLRIPPHAVGVNIGPDADTHARAHLAAARNLARLGH